MNGLHRSCIAIIRGARTSQRLDAGGFTLLEVLIAVAVLALALPVAVLMASGHSINIPTSPFDSVRALTATIAAELGDTAVGSDHYGVLFTLGIFLFLVTFVINLTADLVVRGVREQ